MTNVTQQQRTLDFDDARETRSERYARIASLVATGKITTASRLFDYTEATARATQLHRLAPRAECADDANHEGPILPILPGPYLG